MALTRDNKKLNVEKDSRPPSVLQHILNDKPEKIPWWHVPKHPPKPPGLQNIDDYHWHITHYISAAINEGIRVVLIVYAAVHGGVVDLTKFTDEDLKPKGYRRSKQDENLPCYYMCSLADMSVRGHEKINVENYKKVAKELCQPHTVYSTECGPFFEPVNDNHCYRLLHPIIGEAALLAFADRWSGEVCKMMPAYFIPHFAKTKALCDRDQYQRTMQYELTELSGREVVLRIFEEIIKGNGNDQLDNINFTDDKFIKLFISQVENDEKNKKRNYGRELILAVDKLSPENRPRSVLYCAVAQKIAKTKILPYFMELFDKCGIDKKYKGKQLQWTTEAACRRGHFDAYKILSKNAGDFKFETLRCAVVGKNPSIVENLIQRQRWSETQLGKALEWACLKGNEQVYKSLRELGACPTEQCPYECALGGNIFMLMELLQSGYDFHRVFPGGTALHAAAESGNPQTVEMLLQQGLDPNSKNSQGQLPIHMALSKDVEDVSELLLLNGTDANAADNQGITPIHIACSKGYYKIFELLLNCGADVFVKDLNGRNALHRAVFSGNVALIDRLISMGIDGGAVDNNLNSIVHYATLQGHSALVERFVDLYPHFISSVNKQGWNPMLCAAVGGHCQIVQFLVRNGADVMQKTHEGETIISLVTKSQALTWQEERSVYLKDFDETIELAHHDDFYELQVILQGKNDTMIEPEI